MIATILRRAPGDRRASITAWRQLTDILAQRGNRLDEEDIRRGLRALAVLRADVPEPVRRDCARAVARHGRFAPLVAFYANDAPAVSATMLRRARLSESDWLALLPATSPAARSVLAGRDDLPEGARRALAALGAASVALPQPDAAESTAPAPETATPAAPAPSQISELVRRIDKFQSTRARTAAAPSAAPEPRARFQFETGADGVIRWVDGIARGAAIGLSIADAAFGGEPGTDGHAAGAFRQRAEMINARLMLEGSADESGEWRFSALPWFDPATGQFRGYRGTARRPQHNETPYGRDPAPHETGDSIRQLIHELRSPLNAISGFAQIIAQQMFGPVNQGYRAMADKIVADAAAVQSIIDDLETAARAETPAATEVGGEVVDMEAALRQVEADLAALLAEQGVELRIARLGESFRARAADANARRMIGRLLTALVDISETGTVLAGELVAGPGQDGMLQLSLARPAGIRLTSAADLLDPGFSPEGEAPGAAILSLGFSLRLVDSLARAAGGRLDIADSALTLHLPSANRGAEAGLEVQRGE